MSSTPRSLSTLEQVPRLSVEGYEDKEERMSRLRLAFDTMCALVRVLWPGEAALARDPRAVCWDGALVSLSEDQGHLCVAWKDEDHWEKYAKVVELAWNAAGFESGRIIHDNADPKGLKLPQAELLF
jgi:hypothetical protein